MDISAQQTPCDIGHGGVAKCVRKCIFVHRVRKTKRSSIVACTKSFVHVTSYFTPGTFIQWQFENNLKASKLTYNNPYIMTLIKHVNCFLCVMPE